MITFYLIILLCLNELLEKTHLKNGQLYLQIIGSLGASILLLLPATSFDLINLVAIKSNEYFVTGIVIIFGCLKLFEIIATGKKKIEKIQLPLFVLVIISQSNIYLSLFTLIVLFILKIRKNEVGIEIEKNTALVLFSSGFLVSMNNLGLYEQYYFYGAALLLLLLASNPVLSLISINIVNLSFNGHEGQIYFTALTCIIVWIGFILLYWTRNKPNFLNKEICKIDFYYKARSQKKNNFYQIEVS